MSGTVFPDFVFNNNNIIQFSSLDALVEYAQTMLNKPMYGSQQTFTTWNDAFKRYFIDEAPIKRVNTGFGEYWELPEIIPESNWVARGDYVTVSSGSASAQSYGQAQAVGGGGVKSAPTVQTIVTDEITGEAVEGQAAKGLKNFGIQANAFLANLINALANAMGIAGLVINAQNSGLYRKICADVFGISTPEDITLDDLKSLLSTDAFDTIVWLDEQDNLVTAVPYSIVEKLYDFFAEHIVALTVEGEASVYFPITTFQLCVWGESSHERYLKIITNVSPRTGEVWYPYASPSDSMLTYGARDFLSTLIGSGFVVSDGVSEGIIASMTGLVEKILTDSSNYMTRQEVTTMVFGFQLDRGQAPPPKTTPISANEIKMFVKMFNIDMHVEGETAESKKVVTHNPVDSENKYLKRGRTGENVDGYGYSSYLNWYGKPEGGNYKVIRAEITYPSNVQTVTIVETASPNSITYNDNYLPNAEIPVNGFTPFDYYGETPASGYPYPLWYSNLGFAGIAVDYEFDEELSAGFVKRQWFVPAEPDLLPHDNATIDGVYPQWVAQAKTLSQTDNTGDEKQKKYLPVKMEHGSDNAKKYVNQGTNPNSPMSKTSQGNNQHGSMDPNTDINDINEELEKTVNHYDDSQYTPEYSPDPIPEGYPNPKYPVNPPTIPSGESDDTPTPTSMVGVTASGMCSVYNPTKQELINFSAWLWSPNFLDNFLKIFQNPIDAIIGLHIMYATPSTTTPANIVCGYLDSGVSAKVVDQQFTYIDCGTVTIPEYYGTAIDYEPYTQIHCYLPFIGIVSLKPNDVIGKQLNIKYGVDAMTGTCLAILTCKKGSSEIACYTFAGNCATQIPISGGSYAQVITSLAGFVASGVGAIATANPLMALGAGASLMNTHLDVGHSGAIGANAGAMGIRKPYLIVTRKSAYEAGGYSSFYGYPANKTVILGTCKGYTRVKSVHIESILTATADEKQQIEVLLNQGVIIR